MALHKLLLLFFNFGVGELKSYNLQREMLT